MKIELAWDDKRKKWRGPGGKLRRGPWGLYDAETNTWVGNDSGPVMYTDEIIARVSAEITDIMLGQQPGRTKHRRLPGGVMADSRNRADKNVCARSAQGERRRAVYMKMLLCEECATQHGKIDGTRMALGPAVEDGIVIEPAEYERVQWGRAKEPLLKNRIQYVNGAPFPLDPHQYECDLCSAVIKPGERCCAQSVWLEHQEPVPAWEGEFIE